jgi:signal peptidase I
MGRKIGNRQLMTTFEEILSRDGRLIYKTKGVSMQPMLYQNRDLVIIETFEGRLKPYDVALYRRGRQYVLHRVLSLGNGVYYIRGDNTYMIENVAEENVLGVLTGFVRDGKQHQVTERSYRFYSRFWHWIYPLRVFRLRFRSRLRKLLAKLGLLEPLKKILRALGLRK